MYAKPLVTQIFAALTMENADTAVVCLINFLRNSTAGIFFHHKLFLEIL